MYFIASIEDINANNYIAISVKFIMRTRNNIAPPERKPTYFDTFSFCVKLILKI